MLLHPRSRDRPFHLGRFPLEALPRDAGVIAVEAARAAAAIKPGTAHRTGDALAQAVDHYRDIFSKLVEGTAAAAKAPS